MISIHKYMLEADDEQVISIKGCIKPLSVDEQHGKMVLYVMVETDSKQVFDINVSIRGTGHDATTVLDDEFLGTIKLHHGNIMFHVFWRLLKINNLLRIIKSQNE